MKQRLEILESELDKHDDIIINLVQKVVKSIQIAHVVGLDEALSRIRTELYDVQETNRGYQQELQAKVNRMETQLKEVIENQRDVPSTAAKS